jgi:hypothetical protein
MRETFTFTVMPSNYLSVPEAERESFILEIVPQDADCQKMFRGVWGRMSLALKTFHEEGGQGQAPEWTRWKPGDWYEQKDATDRQRFAAWVGPAVVGMLNVRPEYPSAYEQGATLLYIEHIASSPGDINTAIWSRRLAGVGTALMAYAVLESCLQGFDGRIGLHASDLSAKSFYNSLSQKYQMFCDPPKKDVPGTPQDSKARDRFYFEALPEKAREFLEEYRNA